MRPLLLALTFLGCTAAPVISSRAPDAPRPAFEVEAVSGLGLFADEQVRSQALLSAALGGREAGLVPPEVTQRAWALAAEGRNPVTGATCGLGLSAWQARKRWGPALGVAGNVTAQVWCEDDGGCQLDIAGRSLEGVEEDRLRRVAPFPAGGEALGALASALRRLAPPAPDPGGGMGGLLGALGENAPIQQEDRLEVSAWPADQRDRRGLDAARKGEPFPSLTVDQVLACQPPVSVLVEVNAGGTITRCEGEPPTNDAARCACGQLQRVAAASWLAGKRWSVRLEVDWRDQLTSDRRLVLSGSWNTYLERYQKPGDEDPRFRPKVEDPSIEAWIPGSSRLATGCFTSAFTQAGRLSSRWAIWFDGAGRPIKVVEQQGFPPLPKDLSACVARFLKTAQSPCPSRTGLWAMADLHVSARDPAAPPAAAKDLLKSAP